MRGNKLVRSVVALLCLLFSSLVFAKDFPLKHDSIVGYFRFSEALSAQQVAQAAEELRELDSNFTSLIVSEIRKKTFGIFCVYKASEKIKTPADLTKLTDPILKKLGVHYEGVSLSNDSILIK